MAHARGVSLRPGDAALQPWGALGITASSDRGEPCILSVTIPRAYFGAGLRSQDTGQPLHTLFGQRTRRFFQRQFGALNRRKTPKRNFELVSFLVGLFWIGRVYADKGQRSY